MSLRDWVVRRILAMVSLTNQALQSDVSVARLLRVVGYDVGRGAHFSGYALHPSSCIAQGAVVDRGVRIGPDVVVGPSSSVRAGACLCSDVRIGENCIVGEEARLERLRVGNASMIEYQVLCVGYGDGHIWIGDNSYIGVRNVLDWSDDLFIGSHVHVAGPSTAIWTHTSVWQALAGDDLSDKSRRERTPVRIGDNVYIGCNCTIYPGITVGDHSVVLPNSVVNKDIPASVLAGGVPAKVIRPLDRAEQAASVQSILELGEQEGAQSK